MANLHPPYPIYVGSRKSLLHADDTDESRGIFSEVILHDNYSFRKLARSGKFMRIVDIGANIGVFSVLAALAAPDSVVHAYEPHPEAFKWLSKNANGLNVNAFNLAVADKAGQMRFDIREATTLSGLSETGSLCVSAVSPADILPGEKIDFLKVDCEGAEFLIFKDFELLRRTNFMAMEYHLTEQNTMARLQELIAEGQHEIMTCVRHPAAPAEYGIITTRRRSQFDG